jgi:hypothetical protein
MNTATNMFKTVFFAFLLLSVTVQSMAQQTKAEKKQAKKDKQNREPQKGDLYLTPVPIFSANPAFGFIYGAGLAASGYMGEPSNTNLSSALAGLAFTTKKQTIFTVKSTVFTGGNNWILMGDWRYLNSSQPTWGLGTGPQSKRLADNNFGYNDGSLTGNSEADMLKFKFFRFYETALKKINENGFYAGVGLHVDYFYDFKDQLLDLSAATPVITPFYAYNKSQGFSQTQSKTIGLSANALLDTRDNINNPYKGRYAFVSFKVNPSFIGSDQTSTSLWLEYRDYLNFTADNNNILAVWVTGSFTTSGALPYMNLPATAWDQYGKSGEPYPQGRFRGKNLVFGGLEYRKHLFATQKNPKFFDAVAYLNATTADGVNGGVKLFEYIEPGYGLGVRVNLSQKSRTNIGIDYGFGNYSTTGLFLRLNENF